MAVSFPAPEAAAKHGAQYETDQRAAIPTLIVSAGDVLRRCYQRACAAIFEGEGDCMRL